MAASRAFRRVPSVSGQDCHCNVAILDVRSSHDFELSHLLGAYNVPWTEISNRGFELPPRSVPMVVCCEDDDERANYLASWFETRTAKCIWRVEVVKFSAANAQAVLAQGHEGAYLPQIETGPSPQGRFLFCLSPLLAESSEILEKAKLAVLEANAALGTKRRPQALDVGSGSGRDAILLAAGGWHVTALDRDIKALRRFALLAERQGLRQRTVHADLQSEGDLLAAVHGPPQCTTEILMGQQELPKFDVVTVCRYLHRPTLPELAALLAPKGFLLIHTFVEGCSHPTDPRSVLQPGELQRVFSSLRIVRDDVCEIDDGRILSFFVAQAPDSANTGWYET